MTDSRGLLAKNIKKYRKIKGVSQEDLAERAKTSLTHIGMIEIGRKFPSVNMLEKIAGALGIDTPELFSAGTAVPTYNISIERLYHEILDEVESFKTRVTVKIKNLWRGGMFTAREGVYKKNATVYFFNFLLIILELRTWKYFFLAKIPFNFLYCQTLI